MFDTLYKFAIKAASVVSQLRDWWLLKAQPGGP